MALAHPCSFAVQPHTACPQAPFVLIAGIDEPVLASTIFPARLCILAYSLALPPAFQQYAYHGLFHRPMLVLLTMPYQLSGPCTHACMHADDHPNRSADLDRLGLDFLAGMRA